MTHEEILNRLNALTPGTLMETLDIQYTFADPKTGKVQATMPVSPKVHQPMGLLHGGATAALAESLGSASSALYADPKEYAVLGIEISCNHLRSKKEGMVTATAQILHKGRSTHLWEIKIEDEEGRLISHCKLTNMIVQRKK